MTAAQTRMIAFIYRATLTRDRVALVGLAPMTAHGEPDADAIQRMADPAQDMVAEVPLDGSPVVCWAVRDPANRVEACADGSARYRELAAAAIGRPLHAACDLTPPAGVSERAGRFLVALRAELIARYPWATDLRKLSTFLGEATATVRGARTMNLDGAAIAAAWRATVGPGVKISYKALHAL
jgi:hypothetical protein